MKKNSQSANFVGNPRVENENSGNYSIPYYMFDPYGIKKSFIFADTALHGEVFSYDEIMPHIKIKRKKLDDGTVVTYGLISKEIVKDLYNKHHKNDNKEEKDCFKYYEIHKAKDVNAETGSLSITMSYVCGTAEKKMFHFNIPGLQEYLFPWEFVKQNIHFLTDKAYRNNRKNWDAFVLIKIYKLFNYLKANFDTIERI